MQSIKIDDLKIERIYFLELENAEIVPFVFDLKIRDDKTIRTTAVKEMYTVLSAGDTGYELDYRPINIKGEEKYLYVLTLNGNKIENVVSGYETIIMNINEIESKYPNPYKALLMVTAGFEETLLSPTSLQRLKDSRKKVITGDMVDVISKIIVSDTNFNIKELDADTISRYIINLMPTLVIPTNQTPTPEPSPSSTSEPTPILNENVEVNNPEPTITSTPLENIESTTTVPDSNQAAENTTVTDTVPVTDELVYNLVFNDGNWFIEIINELSTSIYSRLGLEVLEASAVFNTLYTENLEIPESIENVINYYFGSLGLPSKTIINGLSAFSDNFLYTLFSAVAVDTVSGQMMTELPANNGSMITPFYVIDSVIKEMTKDYNSNTTITSYSDFVSFITVLHEPAYIAYSVNEGAIDEDEDDGDDMALTSELFATTTIVEGVKFFRYIHYSLQSQGTFTEYLINLSDLFRDKIELDVSSFLNNHIPDLSLRFNITDHKFYSHNTPVCSLVLSDIYSAQCSSHISSQLYLEDISHEFWAGIPDAEKLSILNNGVVKKINYNNDGSEEEFNINLADLLDYKFLLTYLNYNNIPTATVDIMSYGREFVTKMIESNPEVIRQIFFSNIISSTDQKASISNILYKTEQYYNFLDSSYQEKIQELLGNIPRYNTILSAYLTHSNAFLAQHCSKYSLLLDSSESQYEINKIVIVAVMETKEMIFAGVIANNLGDSTEYFIPTVGDKFIDMIISKQINLNADKFNNDLINVYEPLTLERTKDGVTYKYLSQFGKVARNDKNLAEGIKYNLKPDQITTRAIINKLRTEKGYLNITTPKFVNSEKDIVDKIYQGLASKVWS